MIDPVAFTILGYDIYWYGIAYVIGFYFGAAHTKHLIQKHEEINLPLKYVDDGLSYLITGILAGGRLGCFLFYEETIFTLEIFNIRDGGMSFHGAFLGGILGIYLFSKRYKQSFLEISDLTCIGCPIGICLGRISNYINNDIPGKTLFGINHPVSLYEALFEGIIIFIILQHKYPQNVAHKGKTGTLFMFLYAFFRFFLDFFKDEPTLLFFLSTGQLLCISMFITSILIYKNHFQ